MAASQHSRDSRQHAQNLSKSETPKTTSVVDPNFSPSADFDTRMLAAKSAFDLGHARYLLERISDPEITCEISGPLTNCGVFVSLENFFREADREHNRAQVGSGIDRDGVYDFALRRLVSFYFRAGLHAPDPPMDSPHREWEYGLAFGIARVLAETAADASDQADPSLVDVTAMGLCWSETFAELRDDFRKADAESMVDEADQREGWPALSSPLRVFLARVFRSGMLAVRACGASLGVAQ